MVQDGEPHFLDRTAVFRRCASVIDDPIVFAFIREPRVAKKDHDVIRKLLDVRLIEEQQVTRPGLVALAANKRGIEKLERLRIGKLGKLALGDVVG